MSSNPLIISRGRFLTLNTVVRVHSIEVTRTRNEGADETSVHTPAAVEAFREAVAEGWPDGRITWSLSWQALHSDAPNYVEVRKLVRRYAESRSDDVTFIPGGYFANAYNSREQVSRDLHDGLIAVRRLMGDGYKPRSVVAGFLAADNLRHLAEVEDVHVCQGNIWSQYGIDNQDGDGSICYPYYPSREHFCKPAQAADDFIDCVNLDGWTCDFLAARRNGIGVGFNSRTGVGPIETIGHYGPELGLSQVNETTATHFDTGYSLNGFAWVTVCWEICLVSSKGWLAALTRWLRETRARWPDARCVTQGEFGLAWRRHHRDNHALDYRFRQRGTGLGGSDPNLEIQWFMNREFRLALLRDWRAANPCWAVVDYTPYDRPAREPDRLTRHWSLMGLINQKQTRPQDRPISLMELPASDRDRVLRRYPELA